MKLKLTTPLAVIAIMFACQTTSNFSYSQTNWNTLTTNNGYIKFGPASNTLWTEINTSSENFLFYKPIYVLGGSINSIAGDLNLRTSNISRLFIKQSNGNIGIGNSNPIEKLHVTGNYYLQGRQNISHLTNYDYEYALSVKVNRDLTKALAINSSITGEDLFVVWGNGVVNSKRMYADEFSVQPNSIGLAWPDYVFEDDYNLLDLDDIESYIQLNKHLPDVPSEEQISNEGYSINEMNKILLKKIEELTLYVIDLEKRLKNIEDEK